MTTDATETRYDEIAEGYARWWGPVIRPAAEPVLDFLASVFDARREADVLDVGTGTGALAIAALERWPELRVTGIDLSGGMLEVAGRNASERLAAGIADRFVREVAPADHLPYPEATFDVAMSSFVLQLVPSRAAALREIRRVLRPGATLAWVTWLHADRGYEADRVANEVLDEFGFDPPEPDPRPGDVASPAAAALAMRRAGFRSVATTRGELEHAWSPEGYLGFLTTFDEQTLFDELEPDERAEIEGLILERLRRLSPEQMTLRLPVVYVTGLVPDR